MSENIDQVQKLVTQLAGSEDAQVRLLVSDGKQQVDGKIPLTAITHPRSRVACKSEITRSCAFADFRPTARRSESDHALARFPSTMDSSVIWAKE